MPFGGPAQGARDGGVKLVAHPVVVALDLLSLRPVSGPIVGEPAAHRVNPEGQELVERRLKRTQPERALGQQIPVEGFHMPEVENNPVPLGNRSVVYRFRPNNAEKLVRSEEHTSELQSCNLVCRLLLEKKKTCWGASPRRASAPTTRG